MKGDAISIHLYDYRGGQFIYHQNKTRKLSDIKINISSYSGFFVAFL